MFCRKTCDVSEFVAHCIKLKSRFVLSAYKPSLRFFSFTFFFPLKTLKVHFLPVEYTLLYMFAASVCFFCFFFKQLLTFVCLTGLIMLAVIFIMK